MINFKRMALLAYTVGAMMASVANAQSFTVSSEDAVVGDSSVTVDWSWVAGASVTGFGVDIVFDDSLLTPQTTSAGGADTVDGCLANVPTGVNLQSCNLINSTTIRLSLTVLGTTPIASLSPGGTITFDIDGGAAAGDSSTLDASLASVVPTGTSVTVNDGGVDILAAPAPAITVSPTSQAFTAPQGSTDSRTFTVTNSGNASGLTVSNAAISGTDASNFAVTSNNCPTTTGLSVSGTCSIVVEFTPDAISTFGPASLDITSSAGTENITLTGDGTAGPAGALTIEPSSLDFGDVLTNSETATESFTVTNTGAVGSSVDINPITISAPFSIASTGNTCVGADLAKDESCTVSVTFTPTSDGSASDTLSVSGVDGNGDTKTGTSALSGEGVTEPRPTSNPAPGSTQSEVVGPEGSNDFTLVFGNDGNLNYFVSCSLTSGDTAIWSTDGSGPLSFGSLPANGSPVVEPGGSLTVTTSCDIPDTETYTATLSCNVGKETFTYNYECVGLPPLPIPVDNKWALALLALMMLMAASFGFRFIARQ